MEAEKTNWVRDMTYRVEQWVRKIISPITVKYQDNVMHLNNGSDLADYSFDRRYVISSVEADGETVIITLAENDCINDTNWVGEKQASFF